VRRAAPASFPGHRRRRPPPSWRNPGAGGGCRLLSTARPHRECLALRPFRSMPLARELPDKERATAVGDETAFGRRVSLAAARWAPGRSGVRRSDDLAPLGLHPLGGNRASRCACAAAATRAKARPVGTGTKGDPWPRGRAGKARRLGGRQPCRPARDPTRLPAALLGPPTWEGICRHRLVSNHRGICHLSDHTTSWNDSTGPIVAARSRPPGFPVDDGVRLTQI